MFEDSVHFFLVCPLYVGPRNVLLNFVTPLCPPNMRSLLYGCPDLDFETNKQIYLHTINFVKDTKRFD